MNQLNIQKFIKEHNDWFELLQQEPYCIKIKHENNLYNFNYSQLDSDFNNEIVRECRGLILEDKTFNAVCVPFYKFGNYGEEYADDIDWSTARVQEKLDGTLMCVWYYDNQWHYSTRGNIDAYDASLPTNIMYDTFGDLFNSIKTFNVDILNKNCTYMFELCSIYNKVVITYNHPIIYHIGTRNNITLEEVDEYIGVLKPIEYNLHTLDDCINTAKKLNGHEGFVVVDSNWNRIKVKNPAYVAMHRAVNNHTLPIRRLVEIIDSGEKSEFLSYFPEYKAQTDELESYIKNILYMMQKTIDKSKSLCYNSRKEAADVIKVLPYAYLGFMSLNKDFTALDYWNNLTPQKKADIIMRYKEDYDG